MNFDLTDIMTVFTVISCVITLVLVLKTAADVRARNRHKREITIQRQDDLSEYDRIIRITHDLENERQRNSGEHFEDESVYLNRAKLIRESSSFFQWIK